ncbi:MAG: phage holin family protein [Bernardetiaceae bacterium]|nr:phage holin family protein [Bernardetiaceae bacterium]
MSKIYRPGQRYPARLNGNARYAWPGFLWPQPPRFSTLLGACRLYLLVTNGPPMFENLIKFLEINIEIVKLDVREMMAKAMVQLIQLLVAAFFVGLALVFASTALALLIGHWWGPAAGFGVVAGLYALGFGIFRLYLARLKTYLREVVQKQIPENTRLLNELNADEPHEPAQ